MMEVSELVNRTKRCSFQDIRLELPPNQQPLNSSANTIIGKLVSPKILSLPVIKEVVTKAWRPLYPLEVIKLDPNIFLFKFQHETDAQKTFLKRPWSIRGGHLILKKWNPCLTWKEVDFSKTTLWIQIHGLPSLWLSEANLRSIGTMAGEVLELDLSGEGGSVWRRFSRIKIECAVEQPLLPGVFLPRPNLDDLWVSLKYEKLSIICYICGLIGHDEKECNKETLKLQNPFGAQFVAAGPWLRPENDHMPVGIYDKKDMQDKHATRKEAAEATLVPDTPVHLPAECSQDLTQECQPQGQELVGLSSHAICTNSPPQTATKPDEPIAATPGLSLISSPTSGGPTLSQAHSPIPLCPPSSLEPKAHSPHLDPVFPLDHSMTHSKDPTLPTPVSQPSLHPSSPSKTSPKPFNFTASPTKITNTPTSHPVIPHTPTHTLKRKISKEELSTFTKRLRKTENLVEPTFFDPITATLIPQSQIEAFILEEENKAHSPFSPKVHGKPLKGKARNLNSSDSAESLVSVVDAHTLSVHLAEEAGLTMPPPSP